jgi:hypothetical protein
VRGSQSSYFERIHTVTLVEVFSLWEPGYLDSQNLDLGVRNIQRLVTGSHGKPRQFKFVF